MKNIYYQIWVDCIVSFKNNNTVWKWKSMLFMNLAMSFNFMFSLSLLGEFFPLFNKYNLEIDIFKGTSLDALIEGLILYILPIQIINYYFVFYKKKYETFLKTYPFYKGKYFLTYFLLSIGIPFIAVSIIFFNQ